MKQGFRSTATLLAPPTMQQPAAMQTVSRGEVRAAALDLEDTLRTALAELEVRCAKRPEPKTLVRDVVRGRPASETTLLAALVAIARQAPPEALLTFAQRLYLSLLQLAPRRSTTQSIDVTLDHETMAQADGDVWQRRGIEAIRTGDRVTIDRAIDATMAHIWHAQSLLVHLQTAKTALQTHRRHALAGRC